MRFALLLLALVACDEGGQRPPGQEGTFPPDANEGLTPAPIGSGFCCPIEDSFSCDCFNNGGWVPTRTSQCPSICDMAPVNTSIDDDEHGCPVLTGPESCFEPVDAGVPGVL